MKPLDVAFVWHMHQPDYRNHSTGYREMPWGFLHAVKDYGNMVRVLRETEGAKATFNFSPILLEQLRDYVDGGKSIKDVWLLLLKKDPHYMTEQERNDVVKRFFSVNHARCIAPYPRFRQLREQTSFSTQDLRDLQVWFLLSWSGHYVRKSSAFVRHLYRQGKNFTEFDKLGLLDLYFSVIRDVFDLYQQAESDGVIEIANSPYAHPILPLLCDSSIAKTAKPNAVLPNVQFQYPEDARAHVRYGKDVIDDFFGFRHRGMWPSEGAVSEQALHIIKQEGIAWIAADEKILTKSTGHFAKHNVYSYAGLPIVFRDQCLSDNIGFHYYKMPHEHAVNNLHCALNNIRGRPGVDVVTILLDGENCWECYEDDGYPFLSAMYKRLVSDPHINLVTVSEAISKHADVKLHHVSPGSWINGDFDVWIGGKEENKAWEYLHAARQEFKWPTMPLLSAQGSDWLWWYGDHYQTAQADTFDALFRAHLREAYEKTGKKIPDFLYKPVRRRGK